MVKYLPSWTSISTYCLLKILPKMQRNHIAALFFWPSRFIPTMPSNIDFFLDISNILELHLPGPSNISKCISHSGRSCLNHKKANCPGYSPGYCPWSARQLPPNLVYSLRWSGLRSGGKLATGNDCVTKESAPSAVDFSAISRSAAAALWTSEIATL